MHVLTSVSRGFAGFLLTGLIMLAGFFYGSAQPDNLAYRRHTATEPAVIGEWQGHGGRVRYARFEPDGTFAIAPPGRAEWIAGAYTMTGPLTAGLQPPEPWATARVELAPPPGNRPKLILANDAGEIEQLRWFRRSAPAARPSSGREVMLFLACPFIAGALGAAILLFGRRNWLNGALAFGAAAIPAALILTFTLISLQGGGRPDYAWIAVGCATGFALFGLIGGAGLAARLAIAGAVDFGLAGAVFCPAAVAAGGGLPALILALAACAFGGALFGAALELLH